MSELRTIEERLAAMEKEIDSCVAEHAEFRSVHVSRRGVQGGRGETGPAGPQGAPGRDGDIGEAVQAAKNAMQAELQTAEARLSQILLTELQKAGVVDHNGNAVLIPGPAGSPGADSTVPGPKGDLGPSGQDGKDGKPGRDGADGKDGRNGDRGPAGPQGERGELGISNVPGPQGEQGPEGPQEFPARVYRSGKWSKLCSI